MLLGMWDQRYAEPGFAYGTAPNDFVAAQADRLPAGLVLDLAGGEGRNGVFLARAGHPVRIVDGSAVGLEKAKRLAAEQNVDVETEVADLGSYTIPPGHYAGIVSIWAHMPPVARRALHRQVVSGLQPGGVFLLEAYTPDQVALKTGGPPNPDLCMRLADLRQELDGLVFEHAEELRREVQEGPYHSGQSAVVQVVARKPG